MKKSNYPDTIGFNKVDVDHVRPLYQIEKAAKVFRAVLHPMRREILNRITDAEEMTVTQIFIAMKLEQSVASQQLKILREVGLVKTRRDGKYIYYSVDVFVLAEIFRISGDLAKLPRV